MHTPTFAGDRFRKHAGRVPVLFEVAPPDREDLDTKPS
jgi:hypothetical protein